MTKRAMDIVFSSMAVIVLGLLLIPVIIILRLTGEGHVFYRQDRVGKGGRMFGLYKFATMLENSPNLPGGLLTSKRDPRILPFGRILRATKINEIPQLLNVLLGDMSLIGPRPQARPHYDVFPAQVKKEITKVRPGLSGIGSIVFRDETGILARCGKDEAQFYAEDIAPYKGELEIWYVQHQSTSLDLLLLLLTLWIVLFPKSRLHGKLIADLPSPGSVVLARCLGAPLAAETEESTLADMPTIELAVNDYPAKTRLPAVGTPSRASNPPEREHLVGRIWPLDRRSIQETKPAGQIMNSIGSGPSPT